MFASVLWLAGGGGSPSPLPETLVLLAALPLIAWRSTDARSLRGRVGADPFGWFLIGCVVLVPAVQLLPLPPAVWTSLAGRDGSIAILSAVDLPPGWRPFSVSPDRTMAALLSLIVPLAIVLWVAQWDDRARAATIAAVVLMALGSALLGLAQFAAGPDRVVSLYAYVHTGFASGVFANRNGNADLLGAGLVGLAAGWPLWRGRLPVVAAALIAAVLVVAVLATGSRAGIALLIVPAALALWQGRAALRGAGRAPPRGRIVGLGALVLAIAAASALVPGSALDRSFARFDADGDARGDLWVNTVPLVAAHLPLGAGVGAFVPVYAAAEPLASVTATYANRAHNDLLELALEGGWPALALLCGVAAWVVARTREAVRSADPHRRAAGLFAGGTALILALHSVVDYPLRTLLLLGLAGLVWALLLRPAGRLAGRFAGRSAEVAA